MSSPSAGRAFVFCALVVAALSPAVAARADDVDAGGAVSVEPDPVTSDEEPAKAQKSLLEGLWTRDKLTGDWGGLRTDLHDRGIDIDLRLTHYGQGVASGGVRKNGEYGATMDYRLNADLHKLIGTWEGLSVNVHARTRWGEDVNADAGGLVLPNAGLLAQSPGDYNDTDVTGLMVSQMLPFFEGRLLNVAVGMFDVIDLVTMFFPHIGYGQEGFFNTHVQVSALPWFGAVRGLSLYGALAGTVNQEFATSESGFLVVGTKNVSTSWEGISDSFDGGAFMGGWHRFFWHLDDKPGYFMIFAGGSTNEQVSNINLHFAGVPGGGLNLTEERDEPWNVALYVYQEIWQAEGDPSRNATFFMGATLGPDEPQFGQWAVFANLEAFGLIPSRPHDRMGFGGWWNGLSENFKDLVSPVAKLRDLWGFELYYNVAINPWLHLTPDLQLVQNEFKGDDFAVIPGVRLTIDF